MTVRLVLPIGNAIFMAFAGRGLLSSWLRSRKALFDMVFFMIFAPADHICVTGLRIRSGRRWPHQFRPMPVDGTIASRPILPASSAATGSDHDFGERRTFNHLDLCRRRLA